MRTEEQELIIQTIRSGTVTHRDMVIVPATIDRNRKALRVYNNSYNDALEKDIMTDQMLEHWMIENNLLPMNFLVRRDQLTKQLENLKVELFEKNGSKAAVKQIKKTLKGARQALADLLQPKTEYTQNTCEFIANMAKIVYVLKHTVYKRGKKYRFSNYEKIVNWWQTSLLSESEIRAVARSPIWKSLWASKGYGFKLFVTRKNADMTINQKNLVTWSRVYDNVHESMDAPTDRVIEDDDMLDGWFIVQSRKREKDQTQSEAEKLMGKSSSMQDATHVMINRAYDNIDIDELNNGMKAPDLEQSLKQTTGK